MRLYCRSSLWLLLFVALLPALVTAQEKSAPPNILFLSIDDLRPELGCYGRPYVQSPNIDQLAKEGVTFTRAYCQAPVCGASRASVLTGLRPKGERFASFRCYAQEDAPGAKSLPQVFKESGYYTISNGKIFHQQDDMDAQSWTEPAWRPDILGRKFLDEASKQFILRRKDGKKRGPVFENPDLNDNAYYDGMVADKTIADLKKLAAQDQPFFLACGFVRPHLPLYAPKKYWDLYQDVDIQPAANRFRPKNAPVSLAGSGEIQDFHDRGLKHNSLEFHKQTRRAYYACVSYIDAQVGRIMGALDDLGLADNTIVVLWGDHGWHLGEHSFWAKNNLLHNAIQAPLIMRLPGNEETGMRGQIVELVDLFPTLCELASLEAPKNLEGKSFAPILVDAEHAGKEAAFCTFKTGQTVITERYTYTRYVWGRKGERMLFGLQQDPSENQNLAGQEELIEVQARLDALLPRIQAAPKPPAERK